MQLSLSLSPSSFSSRLEQFASVIKFESINDAINNSPSYAVLLGIQLRRGDNLRESEREGDRSEKIVPSLSTRALIKIEISTRDESTLPFFLFQSKFQCVVSHAKEGGKKKEGRKNASERIKTHGRSKELVGSPVEHDRHRSDSGRSSGRTMERRG